MVCKKLGTRLNFLISIYFNLPLSIKCHISYSNLANNTCDCQTIEKVKSFKYLGVIFDENINWEDI